jgi:hypothetical protein
MLNPTPTQILRNIEMTLVDVVEPAVTTTTARSALATIGHLLRHVILYVEQGGGVLAEDVADSYTLLDRLVTYYRLDGSDAQLRLIVDAVTQADQMADDRTSLNATARRAAILRQAVQDALIDLQEQRAEKAGNPAYNAIRKDIRDYLARQLSAEAALIHPAFADKGPRR